MDTILSHIALRDTLAPENSPILNPDRTEEIKTIANAATYIFIAKFPDLFPSPVIPEAPEPVRTLPEDTREFISLMLREFIASYTLATIYSAADPAYSEHHRSRAQDCVDSLRVLGAPRTMFG